MNSDARSRSTRIGNAREIRPSESKPRWVPHLCTLEGFREDIQCRSGVDLREVAHSGGTVFGEPVEASLGGSSVGGSMLKTRWIGFGMRMEIYGEDSHIVTSPVRSVQAEDNSSLPGPF